MFGMLQATLTQFKASEEAGRGSGGGKNTTGASSTSRIRREREEEIEARIEARLAEERAAARQERADLFRQRKEHQVQLGLLQQKMRMMHEVCLLTIYFPNSKIRNSISVLL